VGSGRRLTPGMQYKNVVIRLMTWTLIRSNWIISSLIGFPISWYYFGNTLKTLEEDGNKENECRHLDSMNFVFQPSAQSFEDLSAGHSLCFESDLATIPVYFAQQKNNNEKNPPKRLSSRIVGERVK
jgi:hypothetical protein